MHLQNRNLHGKIFGGLIMKEAYELGWLCAHLHLNSACQPEIYHIDDFVFKAPVEIGSTLKLDG